MKFVLLVYQGTTPLPGSDRWQTLSEAEQKAIYADYAELNKTEGVSPGLPLGLPDAAKTVQMRDGQIDVKNGTYLAEGAGGYSVYEAESMKAAIALRKPAILASIAWSLCQIVVLKSVNSPFFTGTGTTPSRRAAEMEYLFLRGP